MNDKMDEGLTQLACNVAVGHSEGLTINPLLNPLYALKTYFSFVALNRQTADPDHLAFWQDSYEDFGVLGSVFTVAYPAISPSGELVGVAGVDVQVDGLSENLKKEIRNAVQSRRTKPPAIAINSPVIHRECNIGVNDGADASCSLTKAVPVCEITDKKYLHKEVLCCEGCGGFVIEAKNRLKILWICLGVAGPSALVACVVWLLMRLLGRPVLPPPPPSSPKQPKVAPQPQRDTL